jgi:hypothetical protein
MPYEQFTSQQPLLATLGPLIPQLLLIDYT